MPVVGQDSLKTRRTLTIAGKSYDYFSLKAAEAAIGDLSKLPFSMKVLVENLLRYEDGRSVTVDDVKAAASWAQDRGKAEREIAYRPARVLMQDFTGVPAVVDLAAMRDAVVAMGGDPKRVNPLSPVDLVIDHSVMIDYYGQPDALKKNMDLEFERNGERYAFLRWGQTAFDNFRVVPPGTGICHQVNCEYLAQVVWLGDDNGKQVAYPDTLVGTDSHTTMVNGLAVLGWGVGGIEAEAAMLGQPISMLIPEVVGFKLTGAAKEGITATDVVLTVTQLLRKKGVVGKFVEFFGRDSDRLKLVEEYAKAQGLWRDAGSPDPVFTDTLELDLSTVEPSLAGPKRPQDRVTLSNAKQGFADALPTISNIEAGKKAKVAGASYELGNGDVVIAAITSCTNTSNPSVLIAAGLVAKKAVELGLKVKPWVKTSLAPGSHLLLYMPLIKYSLFLSPPHCCSEQ